MKRLVLGLIFGIFFSGTLRTEKPSIGVVSRHGKPTKELLKILANVGITTNGTLSDIILKIRAWIIADKGTRKINAKTLELLTQIGTIKSVLPERKKYDHIFVMCEGFENILRNLAFTWHLISEKKLVTHDLIFLPTSRLANPLTENNATLKKLIDKYRSVLPFKKGYIWGKAPVSEADFVQLLFAQLDLPKKLHLKFSALTLPVVSNLKLPNLVDKLAYAAVTHFGAPGHCLFVVGNPLIGYQNAVVERAAVQIRKFLQDSDSFDVAGPTATNAPTTVAQYLDIIARWVFEEMVRIRLEKPLSQTIL